jgi:hypothetical protein
MSLTPMINVSTKRETERAATTFSEDDKTGEVRTTLTEQSTKH